MAILKLAAKKRKETGTRAVRLLRDAGFIPANVYSDGQPSALLKLDWLTWTKALDEQPHLVMLKIGSGASELVTLREVQRDPLTQTILHVDLQRVRSDQAIHFSVRVELEGTASGVKDGGVLSVSADHVEVECLPSDVPDSVSCDISGLGIGDGLTAGVLELPEGVKLVTDPSVVLASVIVIRITVEEEEAEAAAAEAAAAEAAEAGEAAPEGEEAAPKEGEAEEEKGGKERGGKEKGKKGKGRDS